MIQKHTNAAGRIDSSNKKRKANYFRAEELTKNPCLSVVSAAFSSVLILIPVSPRVVCRSLRAQTSLAASPPQNHPASLRRHSRKHRRGRATASVANQHRAPNVQLQRQRGVWVSCHSMNKSAGRSVQHD